MIDSVSTSNFSAPSAPRQASQDPALSLTITPSSDNVETGDKSKNTANINITTESKELSATVSREQAFDKLENNLLRKAIDLDKPGPVKSLLIAETISNSDADISDIRETAVDVLERKLTLNTAQLALNGPGSSGPGPVKSLLIADAISNSDSDIGKDAAELSTAVLKNRAVQSSLDSFNNNSAPNNNNNSNTSTVGKATDFYIKSTLFFSTVDRVGQKIDDFS